MRSPRALPIVLALVTAPHVSAAPTGAEAELAPPVAAGTDGIPTGPESESASTIAPTADGVSSGLDGGHGASAAPEAPDRFSLWAHGEMYAQLFQRALLPGPNGTIVTTETIVPWHHYVRLGARDLDTAWREDSIDVELSLWAADRFDDPNAHFDGDVQTANVGYRHDPVYFRLGRQHAAGGAARYVRFDGLSAGAELGRGVVAEGYGGFTVLPRWNNRVGYHHLGVAAGSLVRDPDALPQPDRSGYRLFGGRLGWTSPRAAADLSFHEQHERGGIAYRRLALQGRGTISSEVAAGALARVSLDAGQVQDARLWVDLTPVAIVDATLEYLHTDPSLFVSRQSVLSAFGTSAYDEMGGTATLRAASYLVFEGGAWAEIYQSGTGSRGEIAVRVLPGGGDTSRVRVGYSRVLAVDNGYHAVRASIWQRLVADLSASLDAYGYFYDEAIEGQTTSQVYGGSLAYQIRPEISVLWGGTVAQSPYARVDAQTLLRAAYDLDFSSRSEAP